MNTGSRLAVIRKTPPTLTKAEVARRQLGTALALYLKQHDPVSVHVLACAGNEIAEGLSVAAGKPTYQMIRLEGAPEISTQEFKKLRSQYWNAFKHMDDRKGQPRDDNDLLASFTEEENSIRLFMGWFDYGVSGNSKPIEAQVFEAWFLARDLSKLESEAGKSLQSALEKEFPNLGNLSRGQQHKRLLRMIEREKQRSSRHAGPLTDPRPLILGAL